MTLAFFEIRILPVLWDNPKIISLEQLKLFILSSGSESGSVSYQVTIDPSTSLYNPPHKGEYTLSLDSYTTSEHLKTTIVHMNISPYGDG